MRDPAGRGGRAARALGTALVGASVLAAAVPSSPVAAQGHQHGAAVADAAAWRMPPMDATMPMLPGLEGALPPVDPFLPGAGVDPATVPEARPARVVAMEDGDTLSLEVGLVRRTLLGRTYLMYGYNGMYPGPRIRARQGSTLVVRVANEIPEPTTVHWHGVRIDNRFDGVPGVTQAPIAPGEVFVYQVHVRDAGLYWYHPHVREYVQQDLGLYGNLMVDAPQPDYYAPADREEVLVLDDLLVDEVGLLPWGAGGATHALMGRFGNLMLVNGDTDYALEVDQGDVVRFLITNVANSRTFNVKFGGAPTKLVASDVSRFEREAWVESVPIAPAERYVVAVRFDEPGTVAITNSIQAIDHFRGEFYPHVDTLGRVSVRAYGPGEGPGAVADAFDELREHPAVIDEIEAFRPDFDRAPDHELELTLRVRGLPLPIVRAMEIDTFYVPPMEWNDAMPMMNWLSSQPQVTWILRDPATGLENADIDWSFAQGDVVKLRIANDPTSFHPMHHPIHIHGQRFLVTAVDGVRPPNLAWKDTVIVPVGSTLDLLVEMSNPGVWMLHCHIGEHLDAGMMASFVVSPVSGAGPE